MMLSPFQNITIASLLLLAGFHTAPANAGSLDKAQAAKMVMGRIECHVPKAPIVSVTPSTADIQYDFSRSETDMTKESAGAGTVSPYPTGVDTATGGLRVDHPTLGLEVYYGYETYQPENQACLWYDRVKVTITLKPFIYVAREIPMGPCRDAILGHERHHVDVDHEIVNKYAAQIGEVVKEAVDRTGALGPYKAGQSEKIGQQMIKDVQDAVNSQEILLQGEERRRQALVDSLQEYERVGAICRQAKAFR